MMSQSEPQKGLGETVQSFKQAMDTLTQPMWAVLADFSQLETYVDSLTLVLPLVDFSPLAGLPVSSLVQSSKSVDRRDTLSDSRLAIGKGDRPFSAVQSPRQALGNQDHPSHVVQSPTFPFGGRDRSPLPAPAPPPGGRVLANPPPVFSLRHRDQATPNQHRLASSSELAQSPPSPSLESFGSPSSAAQHPERQTSEVTNLQSLLAERSRSRLSRSTSPFPSGDASRMTPLRGHLPPEKKPDRNFEGRDSAISTPGEGVSPLPAAEQFLSVMAQLDSLASDILLRANSARPSPDKKGPPEVLNSHMPPTFHRNNINNGVGLPSRYSTLDPPANSSSGPDVRVPPSLHTPEIAPTFPAEEASLPAIPTGLELVQPEAARSIEPKSEPIGMVKSGFYPPIDAGDLAMLINEVLVEQARRHGVDLS